MGAFKRSWRTVPVAEFANGLSRVHELSVADIRNLFTHADIEGVFLSSD